MTESADYTASCACPAVVTDGSSSSSSTVADDDVLVPINHDGGGLPPVLEAATWAVTVPGEAKGVKNPHPVAPPKPRCHKRKLYPNYASDHAARCIETFKRKRTLVAGLNAVKAGNYEAASAESVKAYMREKDPIAARFSFRGRVRYPCANRRELLKLLCEKAGAVQRALKDTLFVVLKIRGGVARLRVFAPNEEGVAAWLVEDMPMSEVSSMEGGTDDVRAALEPAGIPAEAVTYENVCALKTVMAPRTGVEVDLTRLVEAFTEHKTAALEGGHTVTLIATPAKGSGGFIGHLGGVAMHGAFKRGGRVDAASVQVWPGGVVQMMLNWSGKGASRRLRVEGGMPHIVDPMEGIPVVMALMRLVCTCVRA